MLSAILLAAAAYVLPPGTYPFRTYGVESGLGNLSAIRIVQDTTGFLWVATQDGAYRYDGNRFRRFGLEDGLPSTFVGSLSAGPRGELWAATGAGIVRFDGNRFQVIDGLPRATANAIASDSSGRLWVAMQQGLFAGTERVAGWEGGASAVWCGADDVWAASTGVVGRLTNGVWTHWTLEPRERIDSVVVDARGRVWARSGNHLWSMYRDGSDVRDESANLPATSNNGYLSLDARGELWVPTDRGVAIHDAGGWRVIGAAQGLPTEWARNVFEDREGSIWVASLGVHRMLGRGELVSYKRGNGLPNEVTWCFRWDRDGHLLVGTDLGLARSTENGWSVVAGTERSQIRSVIEEESGVLWAAGSPPEVIRIDPTTRNVRRYGEADGVRGRAILRMIRARDGAIWAATRGGGLLRKGAEEERFARVEIPGGDAEEDFRDVIEDRNGRIWAGGQRGLARFADGRWSRLTTKDGLRHDHVAYIMESSSGDFWIAYFEPLGLARMRAEDGLENPSHIRIVERLDSSNGVAAKVFIIGEDKGGRLWVGGGTGIDVVGRAQVEHYGTPDGLAGDDTDAMAFLCDSRGHVFVGTSSGFSYYVPRADPPRRGPLAVAITSSSRGSQSRDFAATFSALTYFKPDIVEYEARLAGLDDAWERVSEPRAHWSRLPPGNYRFEVRARLRPGPWSAPAAMSFAVLPAWWQTTSSRAGAVVVFALLIWLVYRWRVAFLRRRNRELEALVAQRTRELADLSVTDALTGLKNRRYLQLCMPDLTSMTLRRHEVLSRAGVDPTRANGDLVCLLLDLDHFKDVNDRHGHRIGDEVLVSLCELVGNLRRESDSVVRWGGEELLYLARDASRAEASVIAERIRSAVEQHQFRVGDGTVIRMTCSIGFAAYPFLPEDPRRVSWEEVLDIADICLYAAKRAGRNCWTGVVARDCLAPETLMARVRQSMPSLVAAGELELLASARPSPSAS